MEIEARLKAKLVTADSSFKEFIILKRILKKLSGLYLNFGKSLEGIPKGKSLRSRGKIFQILHDLIQNESLEYNAHGEKLHRLYNSLKKVKTDAKVILKKNINQYETQKKELRAKTKDFIGAQNIFEDLKYNQDVHSYIKSTASFDEKVRNIEEKHLKSLENFKSHERLYSQSHQHFQTNLKILYETLGSLSKNIDDVVNKSVLTLMAESNHLHASMDEYFKNNKGPTLIGLEKGLQKQGLEIEKIMNQNKERRSANQCPDISSPLSSMHNPDDEYGKSDEIKGKTSRKSEEYSSYSDLLCRESINTSSSRPPKTSIHNFKKVDSLEFHKNKHITQDQGVAYTLNDIENIFTEEEYSAAKKKRSASLNYSKLL